MKSKFWVTAVLALLIVSGESVNLDEAHGMRKRGSIFFTQNILCTKQLAKPRYFISNPLYTYRLRPSTYFVRPNYYSTRTINNVQHQERKVTFAANKKPTNSINETINPIGLNMNNQNSVIEQNRLDPVKKIYQCAVEGKIPDPDIKFGLGAKEEDIVKEWGNPTNSYSVPLHRNGQKHEHRMFVYKEKNIMFEVDARGKVCKMSYYYDGNSQPQASNGKTQTLSLSKVKQILGNPLEEDSRVLIYKAGRHLLFWEVFRWDESEKMLVSISFDPPSWEEHDYDN